MSSPILFIVATTFTVLVVAILVAAKAGLLIAG
jgi:hypothetical protein